MTGKGLSPCRGRPLRLWVGWFIAASLCLIAASAVAGLWESEKKTVVLDPGHGGQDPGVRGPEGLSEKDVTLTFARMMEAELKKAYRVVLTRSDDYAVEAHLRTATANHQKASLFISLHAAASLLSENRGIEVYCFDAPLPVQAAENGQAAAAGSPDRAPKLWDRLWAAHQPECEALAGAIKEALERKVSLPVRIHKAPLWVLKGADMTAIFIEIGYLTNPADEKRLKNIPELSALPKAVSDVVFDFLK